jgi:hypothetical protein
MFPAIHDTGDAFAPVIEVGRMIRPRVWAIFVSSSGEPAYRFSSYKIAAVTAMAGYQRNISCAYSSTIL